MSKYSEINLFSYLNGDTFLKACLLFFLFAGLSLGCLGTETGNPDLDVKVIEPSIGGRLAAARAVVGIPAGAIKRDQAIEFRFERLRDSIAGNNVVDLSGTYQLLPDLSFESNNLPTITFEISGATDNMRIFFVPNGDTQPVSLITTRQGDQLSANITQTGLFFAGTSQAVTSNLEVTPEDIKPLSSSLVPLKAIDLVATFNNSCALLENGQVKCWGSGGAVLGLGDLEGRDDKSTMGDSLGYVDLGNDPQGMPYRALKLSMGGRIACAILHTRQVKCWGNEILGQGDKLIRGDNPNEMGDALPPINLGQDAEVLDLSVGRQHVCVVLSSGQVKCWGENSSGELGLGDTEDRGDEPGEMGDALPPVDLGSGRTAVAVRAGSNHTCALLDNEQTKCWGSNNYGQLGSEDVEKRGDQPGEMGDALPTVNLGSGLKVRQISVGTFISCALLSNGILKCWGHNLLGSLGIGSSVFSVGDTPGSMGDALVGFDLGAEVAELASGEKNSCALLADSQAKCWGPDVFGRLGIEGKKVAGSSTSSRGDEASEMGSNLPIINLGKDRTVLRIAAGNAHTCALLDNGRIKCWGGIGSGTGDLNGHMGDEAGEMGDALRYVDLGTSPVP